MEAQLQIKTRVRCKKLLFALMAVACAFGATDPVLQKIVSWFVSVEVK